MTRALVISSVVPVDPSQTHGVYQRLSMFLDALSQTVSCVECLHLVPAGAPPSRAVLNDQAAYLRERFGQQFILRSEAVKEGPPPDTFFNRFIRGTFDFRGLDLTLPFRAPDALRVLDEALSEGPSIVFAHRLSSMSVLMRSRKIPAGSSVFFDLDDVEHLAFARRLVRSPSWPNERLKLLHLPCLMLGERRAIRLARATFVCSDNDRRHLERVLFVGGVEVIPNSVPFPAVVATSTDRVVLFVGSLSYAPNTLAAEWLVSDIWPRIRSAVPDAQLIIVGEPREAIPSFHRSPAGVTFTGFVEDLESYYRRARLTCCPIRLGSGTRVKIVEAAAHGVATVATPLAAEGLQFRMGSEIVLAEGADELASACVHLLGDPVAAQAIGQAARKHARELYDRASTVARLTASFRRTIAAEPH